MRGIKVLSFGLIVTVFICNGCKKKPDPEITEPVPSYCKLYATVSTDTNYIPHHRNNHWDYCSPNINSSDYDVTISWDSVIDKNVYFDQLFHTHSSHIASPYYTERWRMDSLGNYYRLTYWPQYKDTLLFIKPAAFNGDTLYASTAKNTYIILINRNETVENISGCYHILEAEYGRNHHHYYKKGIGELYLNDFFRLSNAIIR